MSELLGLSPLYAKAYNLSRETFATAVHLWVTVVRGLSKEDLPFDSLPQNIAESLVGHMNRLVENMPETGMAAKTIETSLAAQADAKGDACREANSYSISVLGAITPALDAATIIPGKGLRCSTNAIITAL
jgi:hypothetical protein